MLEQKDLNIIKKTVEEFFNRITISISSIDIDLSVVKNNKSLEGEEKSLVDLSVKLDEPQILIGQGGQTLFEIQKLLRTILNKKMDGMFYLNLDINDYKKKKAEYLKSIAKDLADQVSFTKESKTLVPMSSYERRIIHTELSERLDVVTESQGDKENRHIVINPA